MARALIDRFEREPVDDIVVNAAGCGSHLKDYARLFKDEPAYAAAGQGLHRQGEGRARVPGGAGAPRATRHPLPGRIAYHDACHLAHAQRIRSQPRALLKAIPGVELLEVGDGEQCCGSAGTYNLMEPESADEIGARKVSAVLKTRPQLLASANPGCTLHLQRLFAQRGVTPASGAPDGVARRVDPGRIGAGTGKWVGGDGDSAGVGNGKPVGGARSGAFRGGDGSMQSAPGESRGARHDGPARNDRQATTPGNGSASRRRSPRWKHAGARSWSADSLASEPPRGVSWSHRSRRFPPESPILAPPSAGRRQRHLLRSRGLGSPSLLQKSRCMMHAIHDAATIACVVQRDFYRKLSPRRLSRANQASCHVTCVARAMTGEHGPVCPPSPRDRLVGGTLRARPGGPPPNRKSRC